MEDAGIALTKTFLFNTTRVPLHNKITYQNNDELKN